MRQGLYLTDYLAVCSHSLRGAGMAPLAQSRAAAKQTEKAALDPSPAPVGSSDHTVTVRPGSSLFQ